MQSLVRIQKEYREVQKSKDAGVSAELVDSKFDHWKGTIAGPSGTPYEGGFFVVDIIIPKNYPFEPPKMRFDTKVWHPNVSSANGAICLDILKKEWSPALTLRTALLSLQALLSCPNPDDPQDAEVAGQYKRDKRAYETTARSWTANFATAPESKDNKVQKLVSMGFEESDCKAALEKNKWDEGAAIQDLLMKPSTPSTTTTTSSRPPSSSASSSSSISSSTSTTTYLLLLLLPLVTLYIIMIIILLYYYYYYYYLLLL